jgi:hypothetical protein
MVYGDYRIDLEEVGSGKWKAHIRRTDGKPISTAPYGSDSLPTLSTMMRRSGAGRGECDDRSRWHEVNACRTEPMARSGPGADR